MFKDSQLILTFQLSLIGIILVGGLFLVWKALTRIEEKVDALSLDKECKAFNNFKHHIDAAFAPPMDESSMKVTMEKDPLMKQLFNPDPIEEKQEFVMFSCPINLSGVEKEESTESTKEDRVKIEEIEKEPSEAASETLSKSKLRTMTLEKLKKICEDKKLSSDGTKNQLIDRILQE